MITGILIAFFSLIALITLHEFGHFVLAKRFGVKVEEFGIGYPPRLFGKKFGETLYSLNLIPFGAFVKVHGEEGGIEDYRSFTEQSMWQRVLIILGGVIMFWIVAAILLSVVFALGVPTAVGDDASGVINPKVQITTIAQSSPAQEAGLEPLDAILKLESDSGELKTTKVKEVQDFVESNKGKEITLTVKRWEEVKKITLKPRVSPPEGEGAIGIGLTRTARVKVPVWKAPVQGITATFQLTYNAAAGLVRVAAQAIAERGMPAGARPMGPIGLFDFLNQASGLGAAYFLYFVAVIAIFLAIFNILPIPALDGGKLVFLAIEQIRGRPVSPEIEGKITNFFFVLLIILMIVVTIKFDIPKVF